MKKELGYDEWLGAVKVEGNWHFFADFVGEWILDHNAYNPDYSSSEVSRQFRSGLWVVDETNAKEFLKAMQGSEMSLDNIKSLVREKGAEEVPLAYIVDFDARLFVDGHPDRDVEEYVPKGWTGIKDFPLNYVPKEIKSVWTQNNN